MSQFRKYNKPFRFKDWIHFCHAPCTLIFFILHWTFEPRGYLTERRPGSCYRLPQWQYERLLHTCQWRLVRGLPDFRLPHHPRVCPPAVDATRARAPPRHRVDQGRASTARQGDVLSNGKFSRITKTVTNGTLVKQSYRPIYRNSP